jgi:hypothetical protein
MVLHMCKRLLEEIEVEREDNEEGEEEEIAEAEQQARDFTTAVNELWLLLRLADDDLANPSPSSSVSSSSSSSPSSSSSLNRLLSCLMELYIMERVTGTHPGLANAVGLLHASTSSSPASSPVVSVKSSLEQTV